jgi:hypothetical protein
MGIHSGEAHRAGDDYGGIEVSQPPASPPSATVARSSSRPDLRAHRRRPAAARPPTSACSSSRTCPARAAVPARRPGLPAEFPPVEPAGRRSATSSRATFIGRDARSRRSGRCSTTPGS